MSTVSGQPSALAAILHDAVPAGAPPDQQDTLVQVEAVAEALGALGYRVVRVPLGADLAAAAGSLVEAGPSFVFNLVESMGGGRLAHLAPALVEALGLRAVGCDARALLATSDKTLAKRVMVGASIPTTPWVDDSGLAGGRPLGPSERLIVKSVWEEASIGLGPDSVVVGLEAARELMASRKGELGGRWFAETFVEGREFNVSVLDGQDGPEVLPPAEMRFDGFPEGRPRIVDYEAKWLVGSAACEHTTRSFELGADDRALVERLRSIALACWAVFGLSGHVRVDFRVDEAGSPFVLEVNANPCIAPDSGFVAAAARAGLSLVDVVRRIVRR